MPDVGVRQVRPAGRSEVSHRRRETILDKVRATGYCSLTELGQQLGVSEMTVRRDVRKLEDQRLVRVVHGGVSAVTDLLTPLDYGLRAEQHTAAKKAIATYALTLIRPRAVIGLDAGTTVLELARCMDLRDPITVVSHSLPVMATLARRPMVELISLGGTFHPEGQQFAGALALRSIAQLRIQTLFLATSAVRQGSLWSTNEADAEIKQALIAASDEVVLLADSSKFAYSTVMRVADLAAVSTVVTDQLVSDSARESVAAAGARLVVVEFTVDGAAKSSPRLDP
jgi:DeoR family transcriptional regulator, fructose operon transcriptional repressor